MIRRVVLVSSLFLLALILSSQCWTRSARADWDSGQQGQVLGIAGVGLPVCIIWSSTGEAWYVTSSGNGFERYESFDLPVSVGQVKLLTGAEGSAFLVTTSDEVWIWSGGGWTSAGQFPGGPIGVTGDSWSKIKGRFAK